MAANPTTKELVENNLMDNFLYDDELRDYFQKSSKNIQQKSTKGDTEDFQKSSKHKPGYPDFKDDVLKCFGPNALKEIKFVQENYDKWYEDINLRGKYLFIWNQKLVFIENTEEELRKKIEKIPPKDLFKNKGFIIFVGETEVIRIGAISIPYIIDDPSILSLKAFTKVYLRYPDFDGTHEDYLIEHVTIDTGSSVGLTLTEEHMFMLEKFAKTTKPFKIAGVTDDIVTKGFKGIMFVRVGDVTKEVTVAGPTIKNLLGMNFLGQCMVVMDGCNMRMIISM